MKMSSLCISIPILVAMGNIIYVTSGKPIFLFLIIIGNKLGHDQKIGYPTSCGKSTYSPERNKDC